MATLKEAPRRCAPVVWMAVLLLAPVLPVGAQSSCQQTIDSRGIATSQINDFTEHSYSAPAGPIGSFADCMVTRLFAAPIQGLRVTIVSGRADDIGYVGSIQVTNTGSCAAAANVVAAVDVTSQVVVNGSTATLLLRAQENCCCVTGWGNAPGWPPARLHWEVALETQADTTPPTISNTAVDQPVLWPPSLQMIPVTVQYNVADDVSPSSEIRCTLSVASNEPISGPGSGNTAPDWVIVDPHHVLLRAERAGTGIGRIYTITISCTDSSNNTSSATVQVRVPKSRA